MVLKRLGAFLGVAGGAALAAIGYRWAFTAALPWAREAGQGGRVVLVAVLGGLVVGASLKVARPAPASVFAALGSSAPVSVTASTRRVLQNFVTLLTFGSLGREGPLIQFGGALGSAAGRRLGGPPARWVGVGMAAGFAAAYLAPLSAVLFVFEVGLLPLSVEAVAWVLGGALGAWGLARAVFGGAPLLGAHQAAWPDGAGLAAVLAVSLAAALAGRGLTSLMGLVGPLLAKLAQPGRALLGATVVGACVWALPSVAGNGYEPLRALVEAPGAWPAVLALLLLKPVATALTLGGGTPGGVLTPTLLVGACVGALASALAAHGGVSLEPTLAVLVGMAACFAATSHAPVLSAIFVFELTGAAEVLPVLAVAALVGVGASRFLHPRSVYDEERARPG
jgi:CIC family chloride channel protein